MTPRIATPEAISNAGLACRTWRSADRADARPLGFKVRVSPQAQKLRSRSTDGRPAAPVRHAFRFVRCRPSTMRPSTCGKAEAAGAHILSELVAVRVDVGTDGRVDRHTDPQAGPQRDLVERAPCHHRGQCDRGPQAAAHVPQRAFSNGVANSSGAVGRYLMDHPVQLTKRAFTRPGMAAPGTAGGERIHELRDGDQRRHHGAFLMNIGNQGWEWAGPILHRWPRRYVDAGLFGRELLERCPVARLAGRRPWWR